VELEGDMSDDADKPQVWSLLVILGDCCTQHRPKHRQEHINTSQLTNLGSGWWMQPPAATTTLTNHTNTPTPSCHRQPHPHHWWDSGDTLIVMPFKESSAQIQSINSIPHPQPYLGHTPLKILRFLYKHSWSIQRGVDVLMYWCSVWIDVDVLMCFYALMCRV
jgi:hypothetical protein